MRPSGDHILRTVANALVTEHMPAAPTDKAKAELGLFALLLGVVSEELERGAARWIEENAELRRLFLESLSAVREDDLRVRLRQAAGRGDTDYRLSALDEANSSLVKLLIELHRHVEGLKGQDARKVEENISRVLENWTKRREFSTNELFLPMILASAVEKVLAQEAAGETTAQR